MKDTLQEIKDKLAADSAINEEKKKELLGLLDELESDMGAAGKREKMKTISTGGKRTADKLTKEEKDPDLIESALSELSDAVTEVEVSHPKLFEKVNNISAMLASMGI